MELQDKKVLVVGMAQTGIAVADFCLRRGAKVTITDSRSEDSFGGILDHLKDTCVFELGFHNMESFTGADYVVMSPGVPEMEEMRRARAAGVEVIAEIELAYRCFDPEATLIAITGTNGKSTTTALCGALCEASGRPSFCGGNLGNNPLIAAVDHPANVPGGLIVAEVAGFMLETCTSFRPKIGALLNITPDHLDRYGSMKVYASMKTRIFHWLERSDYAVGNAYNDLARWACTASKAMPYLFDSRNEFLHDSIPRGAYWDRSTNELVLCIDRSELGGHRPVEGERLETERYPISDLQLFGTHNMENAMAAYLCARLAGVSPEAIRRGAQGFRAQAHRMELVAEHDGIVFYDDSKGTNVDAVAASVRGFPQDLVLIAGGVDKGGAYTPMFEGLRDVCKGLVLIGEAAPIIRRQAEAFGIDYPVLDAHSMDDAVRQAVSIAQTGQAVVLSPACSSYDMFKNFIERGLAFREAVAKVFDSKGESS